MVSEENETIDEVARRALHVIEGSGVDHAPEPLGRALGRMELHGDPGGVDLSGARLRRLRRVLLKLIRPSTAHQLQFNEGAAEALRSTLDEVDAIRNGLVGVRGAFAASETALGGVAERLANSEEALRSEIAGEAEFAREVSGAVDALRGEIDMRLAAVETRLDDIETRVADLVVDRRHDRGELDRQRSALDATLRALRAHPAADVSDVTRPLDASYDRFYADFEAALRGSRESVREGQEAYLGLFDPAESAGPVLDVGPGRGEWLELLAEKGIEAYGVDINAEFVAEGVGRGLDVRHGDAFEHLRSLPEGSLGGVTAFQVVEHLPFDLLDEFLGLALTRLQQDGVLLVETPNPSNLRVGAMSFWNDPSHVHPLPPAMLKFLVEWRGFVDVEVVFGPSDGTQVDIGDSRAAADLNWALFGPEDYAVVGRRP